MVAKSTTKNCRDFKSSYKKFLHKSIKDLTIMFLMFLSNYSIMEASYKKIKLKFTNLILALIFMGILMLVISYYLPPDINGNSKETLRILGIFFILMGFLVIVLPYIKEILEINR